MLLTASLAPTPTRHYLGLSSRRSPLVGPRLRPQITLPARPARSAGVVDVQARLLLKKLGLPDFAAPKRKRVIEQLFSTVDRSMYEKTLTGDFKAHNEDGAVFSKSEWIDMMCGTVLGAMPDFKWTPVSDGIVDDEGWAIVIVKVTGHHTGAPFSLQLPGASLPEIPASGRRVSLPEGVLKVMVEGEQVKEISVVPGGGAGFHELYRALAGEEVHEAWGPERASYAQSD